jgi:transposase
VAQRTGVIVLEQKERVELDRVVRARTSPQQLARRATIVLRAADGAETTTIAAELGLARHTVAQWRRRFAAGRLAGLRDRPHRPLPRRYSAERQAAIVLLACQTPTSLGWEGQTHWTLVDLARYIQEHPELDLGTPSKSTLGRILQAHDLRLDRL